MKQHNHTKAADAAPTAAAVESRAIYVACASGLLGFGTALIAFWGRDVAMFERGISIGFVASVLGGALALVVYALTIYDKDTITGESRFSRFKQHMGIWSLALVHGLLAFMLYVFLFRVVDRSFIGVMLDQWASSVLVALAVGLAGYYVYLSAVAMSTMRIAGLLVIFLVTGMFVSMLTAQDPQWWSLHFSSLGAGEGVSGYAFNGTLVITGAVVLGLVQYVAGDFARLQSAQKIGPRDKTAILMTAIVGIGIALACVGIFEYNVFPLMHNLSATGMAVCFIGIIAALRQLTPDYPRAFFVASYSLLAGLLVSVWLFAFAGYFNLTVFELVAASVIMTWLVVFIRQTAALVDDDAAARL